MGQGAPRPAAERAPAAAVAARAPREKGDGLDAKPALTSWEMAKFANNVDSAQGQLGTNVAWMYDSLAKRGAYKQVEHEGSAEDVPESEKSFAAERAEVPCRAPSEPPDSTPTPYPLNPTPGPQI